MTNRERVSLHTSSLASKEGFKLNSPRDGDKSPEISEEPGDVDKILLREGNNGNLSNVLREKTGQSLSYLKYLYTNARSKGHKQEQEVLVQLQNFDVMGNT